MKDALITNATEESFLTDFSNLIKDSVELKLKSISNGGFKIVSTSNFGGLSVIEKEKYFINGKLKTAGNKLVIDYTVRANSTFKTVAIVLPIMSFPTLAIAFSKVKPLTGSVVTPLTNFAIYLLFNILSISFLMYKDYRLRKTGKKHFESIISKMCYYK